MIVFHTNILLCNYMQYKMYICDVNVQSQQMHKALTNAH